MTPPFPDAAPSAHPWRALREAFDAVVEQSEAQREAWLQQHVEDASLRAQLRRLLDCDRSDGPLDTSAAERTARIGEAEFRAEGLIGTQVAGYRLVSLLGQGGMASVFLAVRETQGFEHRVALKLMRRGLFSEVEQRLFRRERQALAALSHPDIARLVDGGVTEAGIPYLVLELIDGIPITEFARTLDRVATLRLFVRVCRAVASAHRALIVHRDLKPSNILVNGEGHPKLLDFGIAKLLDESDVPGVDATATGCVALTPGYAAPEQYSNGPISTATDVYALGVVLSELLVGERPQPRSSLRTPSPASGLRGDLATILGHALEAEPERRYATASDLADDIERFLRSMPISARRASTGYRIRKFVSRHRLSAAAGLMLAVGVGTFAGVALVQHREAQAQALRAREVQAFLESLFEPMQSGEPQAGAPTAKQLVQRGLARLESETPADPPLRADLLALFARIQDGLGETEANRALSRDAWQATLLAYGEDDPRTWQARALHGRVLRKVGKIDEALREYEAVRVRMQARDVGGQDYARLLDAISIARMERGMSAEEAIALKHEILAARQSDPVASVEDLVVGYNNLGAAYQYAARFDEALTWYRRAQELSEVRGGDSRIQAMSLANVGHALSYQGRLREADEALQKARSMFGRIPLTQGEGLASLLLRQCSVLAALEWHARARAVCDDAVEMTREVHGVAHFNHALALARRAGAKFAAGEGDASLLGYSQAREILAASSGNSAYRESIVDADQARLWHGTRDWRALRLATLKLLDAPARAGMPHPGSSSPSAPLLAAWAALACQRAPDPACGKAREASALALLDHPAFGASVMRFGGALGLAELMLADGRHDAALALLERSAPWAHRDLDEAHSWRVQWHTLRAHAHAAAGDEAEANLARERASALRARLPVGHWMKDQARS